MQHGLDDESEEGLTMTFQFDLVTEPWIPCVRQDGTKVFLGLLDTLLTAHDLREIHDESPTITVSLHRLLLAVLHHVFGPRDTKAWAQLWNGGAGPFAPAPLRAYFADPARAGRFDLFHEQHPFLQCVDLPFSQQVSNKGKPAVKEYLSTIALLMPDRASGNNGTLFDHSSDDLPQPVTPAHAARLVLSIQQFALGGRITFLDSKDGSAMAGLLCKGAVLLLEGENLFQTLMLNLVRYSPDAGQPFECSAKGDRPAWDRPPIGLPSVRRPDGYLDWLTWQARRIRLQPERTEAGTLQVRHVVMMRGDELPDSLNRQQFETMVAFRTLPKAKTAKDAWTPICFLESQSLWRQSLLLFQAVVGQATPPRILNWIAELKRAGVLTRARMYPLTARGLITNQAKCQQWRHERLAVSVALLERSDLQAVLREAADVARLAGSVIRSCTERFFEQLLFPGRRDLPQKSKEQVAGLAAGLEAARNYWARLETAYEELLTRIDGLPASDSADWETARIQVLQWWVDMVRQLAKHSFEMALDINTTSARGLQAQVYAERMFTRRLYRLGADLFRATATAN
jgi:CRISPR system Cascade subunit CasA